MWTREFMGTDVLHLAQIFIMYSMMGWLIETIYISICDRKLTNRGFAASPLCPIYGFGGLLGYMVLHPLAEHKFVLYVTGALLATAFEFLVAKLMEKTLGDVWWDYSEKPFNYQGVICVESTLAWGLYAVVVVCYLQDFLMRTIDRIPMKVAIISCRIIMVVYAVDFVYHLAIALHLNLRDYGKKLRDTYQAIREKW
ncbi:MAG: putative ABC transporter permease [Lachnospiraceae bacterium]|nr:putative ABC transporter permease [Lachnospiraceae bacterium]